MQSINENEELNEFESDDDWGTSSEDSWDAIRIGPKRTGGPQKNDFNRLTTEDTWDGEDEGKYPITDEELAGRIKNIKFEENEFRPDALPMSFFCRVEYNIKPEFAKKVDEKPEKLKEDIYWEIHGASKKPYKGQGVVHTGHMVPKNGLSNNIPTYLLGYSYVINPDWDDDDKEPENIKDPLYVKREQTFLAKLQMNPFILSTKIDPNDDSYDAPVNVSPKQPLREAILTGKLTSLLDAQLDIVRKQISKRFLFGDYYSQEAQLQESVDFRIVSVVAMAKCPASKEMKDTNWAKMVLDNEKYPGYVEYPISELEKEGADGDLKREMVKKNLLSIFDTFREVSEKATKGEVQSKYWNS